MSNLQHSLQSLDSSSFDTGRYFKIFDTFNDIDVYEHGILTYLGSLLSSIREAISASMGQIAKATKMSVSTVRKKIRSLEIKGHLTVKAALYLNAAGRTQQGANHYLLNVEPTVTSVEKEADKVVAAWEKMSSCPVPARERETFVKKFDQLNQPIQQYLERIEQIAADTKLKRIAMNINFLFLPRDLPGPSAGPEATSKEENIPADEGELLAAINRQLIRDNSETNRQRLEILRDTVSKCSFDLGLKLYQKHIQRRSTHIST